MELKEIKIERDVELNFQDVLKKELKKSSNLEVRTIGEPFASKMPLIEGGGFAVLQKCKVNVVGAEEFLINVNKTNIKDIYVNQRIAINKAYEAIAKQLIEKMIIK